MVIERRLSKLSLVKPLLNEVQEILAMTVASIKTLRSKQK
jgi:hypothetical protein